MDWRIIGLDTNDAYYNMAIDQAIMEGVEHDLSNPTIRFYRWKPSAVSIGRFQSMTGEVNIDRCKEVGVSCVRRVTGGGAVYHDYNGEITYSVIAKEGNFPKGIRESYRVICDWVIKALINIGLDAKFAPINDILVDGKKISGNAQTRKNGMLLQHGTVLYDLDIGRMFSLLKISNEKISDKMIKSVEERVTCVSWHSVISQNALYRELLKSFTAGKEYRVGEYTEGEVKRARELAKDVYGSSGWNFSR